MLTLIIVNFVYSPTDQKSHNPSVFRVFGHLTNVNHGLVSDSDVTKVEVKVMNAMRLSHIVLNERD